MENTITGELIKHGWQLATEDEAHVVLVRRPVKTFRGEQIAVIRPVIWFENGHCSVRAEFVSRGENVLALCCAYISGVDDVSEKIAAFHTDVMKELSDAFSVRMAR